MTDTERAAAATAPALLVEKDGHVVTLTLNRPEVKNAINPEMLCRLADAWATYDDDPEVRAIILTGQGDHFCSGADLTSWSRARSSACRRRTSSRRASAPTSTSSSMDCCGPASSRSR